MELSRDMNYLETADFNWMEMLNFYEQPFRAKLIPSKVWRDLDKYKNDSVGLANYTKKWRTKIEFRKAPSAAKVWKTYASIGGEYSPDERQCALHIYTLDFDKFPFTKVSWDRFKYRFIQTLMHELIHFMQYDRRGDEWSNYVLPHKKVGQAKKDAERKYLSEFDEIQAYAHCVYLDFKMFRPRLEVETLMNRAGQYTDSKTLHYFLKTFNYDYKNNAAIPKIMQQIIKWDNKYQRYVNKPK